MAKANKYKSADEYVRRAMLELSTEMLEGIQPDYRRIAKFDYEDVCWVREHLERITSVTTTDPDLMQFHAQEALDFLQKAKESYEPK